MKSIQDLAPLIKNIADSSRSAFYRDLWGGESDLSKLPHVSRNAFLQIPLSKRRYKNEKGIVKIVHDGPHAFLSEWSFADIGREEYGVPSKRPMVYLTDPHESIEKSMWCYERDMLPLVGEKDASVSSYAASRYQIDSLITDADVLEKFTPYLESRTEPLESISILGEKFSYESLLPYRKYAARVRVVLTLPETGSFAEAELSSAPNFKALPGCLVEKEETVIVSKDRMLATPVIRYRTNIPVSSYDGA